MTHRPPDIDPFLARLFRDGVRISAVDGRLKISGPAAALAPELQAELKARKAEILEALAERESLTGAPLGPQPDQPRPVRLPLSFAQQRLWFLDQMQPGAATYNLPMAIRVEGDLDAEAFVSTLQEVVDRHEILRTRYVQVEGEPVQRIDRQARLDVARVDLRDVADADTRLAELSLESAATPFDLEHELPLRVSLVRCDDAVWTILFTVHHIAADAWSLELLIREIATRYPARLRGNDDPLEPLRAQYADFAVWQRSEEHAQVLDGQLDYWRGQLEGHIPRLQLPTDHSRPRTQSFAGDFVEFEVDASVTERLRKLGVARSATLYMTLLGALDVLLYRYTGQRDLLVGSPVANRHHELVEPLLGLFVSTLVLRARIDPQTSFERLLDQVRETTLEAYDHQDLPFELLVEAIAPDRDPGISPLFQVKFRLENAPADRVDLSEIALERMPQPLTLAKLDLSVDVYETDRGLTGAFEYSTDLFERETIERMASSFVALLTRIADAPETAIGNLGALTRAAATRQRDEWNDARKPYRHDACYHDLFEAQAEAHPDALAVRFDGPQRIELTYCELNARANRLAHHLVDARIGPERPVAICLRRSPEMVVAMLAIMKAGGAYLPLDSEYPVDRLQYMIDDADVRVVIGAGAGPDLDVETRIDLDAVDLSDSPDTNPRLPLSPDNLAYLIYTSGSTGRPKGVSIAHRGLVNLTEDKIRKCDVRAGDCVLQFFSFSFDGSVPEFVMTLAAGAHLLMAPARTMLPGPELAALLVRNGVTHITLTPSALTSLPAGDYPDLRMVLVGGEAPSPELIRQWSDGRHFINAYGPTETTVNASMVHCGNGQPVAPTILPSANKQLYVLDDDLQIAPVGVTGELHIGGVGLARGDLNQPALTAERFVPDPFARADDRSPGAAPPVLYKSGDLAAYLPDGRIRILGRIDQQTKIRGFRIELGEIERTLETHEGIRTAVVVIREYGDDKRLVAYAVADGETEDPAEIRRFLSTRLPHFMLPSALVWIPELPLTPNGKLDADALPQPELSRGPTREPRTGTESVLADAFAAILALDRVGVDDDFFELGGHSLLVTRLVATLKDRFDVGITVMDLFDAPTVAGLAQRIEHKQYVGRLIDDGADDDEVEEFAL